ncbi:MAG: beta-galactosidase trimerization domain-containing protein [Clostridia bacterium]|nr:beta-galactosidase trimerization domain-containing protein [Clostridia bacterium]
MNCVHLDFHTSPDIENIGAKFNKEEFAKTLKNAHVDLITVFAKCHHGLCYYPTKVGTMHPNLKFNLLKEQIDACHSVGIKAPIYITMGWSKKDADEHPEWHHKDFWSGESIYFGSKPSDNLDEPIFDCTWTTLCPVGEYKKHLIDITKEICESFDVSDGVFYDICFMRDACVCESCKQGMSEMNLDPSIYEDAQKYYRIKRLELMKDLNDLIHSYNKEAHIFYNGGADMNRPEYHPLQSHYELEDLPTAWGGYDFMPLRAKSFEKYGKLFLGMTGKFHHAWGEFGGFKNKDALKYELADMMSVGASMSVGDHLHPNGKIDKSTYNIIGHAFKYIDQLDEYAHNTKAYTDLGIWLSHNSASDMGTSKILQIMHLEYDVITSGDDLSKYQCIILPDKVKLSNDDKKQILEFVKNGGKIIASYESVFDELDIKKIEKSKCDIDYIKCDIDEIVTPFLSYSSAYMVECENGEVLAEVYEPYFNRTRRHFCGHKNTPFKENAEKYPALVKKGNVLYFAHPIFEAYDKSGNYILQKYLQRAIESIYDKNISVKNFYSCGRVRVRKSEQNRFYAIHMLYAPPVNRGNVCLIEDFPEVNNIRVTIKIKENIREIISAPDNEIIEFVQNGEEVMFTVNNLKLHKLIVIKY